MGPNLSLIHTLYNTKRKCKHVCFNYNLKSPLSSADFTIYAPGIGTPSYTVSSPPGRIQHFVHFAAAIANHYNSVFSFHKVPWVDRDS